MFNIISKARNFILMSKNKIVSLYTGFSLRKLLDHIKQEYEMLKVKLADIRTTNWHLAQYHLTAGNINDAIMRFKMLQRFNYRMAEINYFLGRAYLEKLDYTNAKSYLRYYLSSSDATYRENAEYCLRVANNDQNIVRLPWDIIVQKHARMACNIDSDKIDDELLIRYSTLITVLKKEKQLQPRILDLGCAIGLLGRIIREGMDVQYMKGMEMSDECIEIATHIQLDDIKIYDDVTALKLDDMQLGTNAYSCILIADVTHYYSDLVSLMINSFVGLQDGGILCIVFRMKRQYDNFNFSHDYTQSPQTGAWQLVAANRVTKENNTSANDNSNTDAVEKTIAQTTDEAPSSETQDLLHSFIHVTEEFAYSPYHMDAVAKQCGFKSKMHVKISGKNPFALFVLQKVA